MPSASCILAKLFCKVLFSCLLRLLINCLFHRIGAEDYDPEVIDISGQSSSSNSRPDTSSQSRVTRSQNSSNASGLNSTFLVILLIKLMNMKI